MGCTHPFVERITDDAGSNVGIRCLGCKSVAFPGDSLWTLIKRNVLRRSA